MTVFMDSFESSFYASCVRHFVVGADGERARHLRIVEFGSGTGTALAEMVSGCAFSGKIRGFEVDAESYDIARRTIREAGAETRYSVAHGDFFDGVVGLEAELVISDPPYLPCPHADIKAPQLWGGTDGTMVTRQIIACGFPRAVIMVSSYSNPVEVIAHAAVSGYIMRSWLLMPLTFGDYSSEPVVAERIAEMAREGSAFVSDVGYWLVGVDWVRDSHAPDQSEALIRALRALGADRRAV